MSVSVANAASNQYLNRAYTIKLHAITDSGAQSNIWSLQDFDATGFSRSVLFPALNSLRAANSSGIKVNGAFLTKLERTAPNGRVNSCKTMIYVSSQVNSMFLSYNTLVNLLIVGKDFPSVSSANAASALRSCSSKPFA